MEYHFPALYFEATRLCNLRCQGCMSGSNKVETVRASRRRELSYEEIRDLVLVPGKRLGLGAVGWSGGEFLLRKDALKLLQLATELGYQCKICTNGEIVSRELLREIKAVTNDKLTLSLGINSIDEHNEFSRDVHPDRTLEVLRMCDEVGIDRHIIVTIGKYNAESFKDTVEYLVKHHISYNRSPYVARGSGCNLFNELGFDRHDMEERFHPTLRRYVNGYVSYTPFFLSPELHDQVSGGARNGTVPTNPPIGCWVGTWLTLNAEGDVSVCPVLLDSLSAGNVREKPIDQLVNESKLFATLLDRSQLKGRCGNCRYQYTCGGCRAMAYYRTGDYMEEDPSCFFDPKDRNTVSEHEEETNRIFRKYLMVARYVGLYTRPERPARQSSNGNGNGAHRENGASAAAAQPQSCPGCVSAAAPVPTGADGGASK